MSEQQLEGPVAFSGWIRKKGGRGISTNWRRRWFELHTNGFMAYYTAQEQDRRVLKGLIDLSQYDSVMRDDNAMSVSGEQESSHRIRRARPTSASLGFRLVSSLSNPPARLFQLQCDTVSQREAWVEAIRPFLVVPLPEIISTSPPLRHAVRERPAPTRRVGGHTPHETLARVLAMASDSSSEEDDSEMSDSSALSGSLPPPPSDEPVIDATVPSTPNDKVTPIQVPLVPVAQALNESNDSEIRAISHSTPIISDALNDVEKALEQLDLDKRNVAMSLLQQLRLLVSNDGEPERR